MVPSAGGARWNLCLIASLPSPDSPRILDAWLSYLGDRLVAQAKMGGRRGLGLGRALLG